MDNEFHNLWTSSHIRITTGPFAGREGQACGTFESRVEVAFPESVDFEISLRSVPSWSKYFIL